MNDEQLAPQGPPPLQAPQPGSEHPIPPAGGPPGDHGYEPPPRPLKGPNKKLIIIGTVGFAIIGLALASYALLHKRSSNTDLSRNSTSATTNNKQTTTPQVSGLKLDTTKNYGDKYANGLLPVGDKKYSTKAAAKGSIYLCNANFVSEGQAGAQTRGPWFTNNNTQWDINKKVTVAGNVSWQNKMSITFKDNKRIVATNDLPTHHTGTFPVAASDPARVYDANPNAIASQTLSYSLSQNPTAGEPKCMGGESGVMLTGVSLFNAFDAGGKDAGAWEVQDSCDGHPQNRGQYHYHSLSRCITDISVTKVIGFALDGFPITGPKVGDKNILTTNDLDDCHGITSEVLLDNKKVTTYHYVMTQDFPYSVSCFRAIPIKTGPSTSGASQTGQQPSPMPPPPASAPPGVPPAQ